jgi:putative DNA methylase
MTTYRKKLIEVALPLEAINKASAREKSIRHGHPSTLHLWWARRPLAACRAVLFASMVDDPSAHPERFPTDGAQEAERQRLFRLIEELVKWENTNNADLLARAHAEIRRSAGPDGPPPVLDPFCGGGSIPLEAQRLGLEAHGSDLNPVAVLITKALIEIPPRFSGRPPVRPTDDRRLTGRTWRGAEGLAEDVRHYGQLMRDEAEGRIGHLYPQLTLPREHGGGQARVIAWLWARTVRCPNPACGAQMPLVRSFALSTKKGAQAWVEPVVDRAGCPPTVRFEVRSGVGKPREGTVNRRGATCVCCDAPVPFDHVRAEGRAGRMGARMMAIVAEGTRGRIYVSPDSSHLTVAASAEPSWRPETDLPHNPRDFKTPNYGMRTFADLFTPRQLVALTTFSDLVGEARELAQRDATAAGLPDDGVPLERGGCGATAYADAVATYLAMGVSRLADICNSFCRWETSKTQVRNLFGRQAIPMIWDYAEPNVFADAAGDYSVSLGNLLKALLATPATGTGSVIQADASSRDCSIDGRTPLISTDPPYYDNIGYADLSDFFYIWLRRTLHSVHPGLFSTLLVPKAEELVATPYRFDGDRARAQRFFEQGLGKVFGNVRQAASGDYPVTVYYAFKQTENDSDPEEGESGKDIGLVASTGWESMLEGLVRSGFAITGTWPMRTELANRTIGQGANALASSIVLVCRPRADDAPLTTRRDFMGALRRELPAALRDLQRGNIAPVDLAQAAIGPGMAVYSRYRRVLEADGSSMTVRTALTLINQEMDAYLTEQEGEYDADTRWALAWFEQFGMNEGAYGDAETLSKAKNTSVQGMVEAGIVQARGGKVRLLRREELPADWNPATEARLTVWEVAQQLILAMQEHGEEAAADLLARVGGLGETARDLAYRLYVLCERKGWAQEALAYNGLVVAWSEVGRLSADVGRGAPTQGELDI